LAVKQLVIVVILVLLVLSIASSLIESLYYQQYKTAAWTATAILWMLIWYYSNNQNSIEYWKQQSIINSQKNIIASYSLSLTEATKKLIEIGSKSEPSRN